jgi:hypothetical protein
MEMDSFYASRLLKCDCGNREPQHYEVETKDGRLAGWRCQLCGTLVNWRPRVIVGQDV